MLVTAAGVPTRSWPRVRRSTFRSWPVTDSPPQSPLSDAIRSLAFSLLFLLFFLFLFIFLFFVFFLAKGLGTEGVI